MQIEEPQAHRLRRREAIALLGTVGAAAFLRTTRAGDLLRVGAADAASAKSAAAGCVLAPEVTEGPYWISNHLTRRNIRDGRPGLPLRLDFTVQDATTCKPIRGADVEVWHADAGGVYSGYSGHPLAGAAAGIRRHMQSHGSARVIGPGDIGASASPSADRVSCRPDRRIPSDRQAEEAPQEEGLRRLDRAERPDLRQGAPRACAGG